MQLQVEVPLFTHGVEIAIQAVEINHFGPLFSTSFRIREENSPGGQFRRIDLHD